MFRLRRFKMISILLVVLPKGWKGEWTVHEKVKTFHNSRVNGGWFYIFRHLFEIMKLYLLS